MQSDHAALAGLATGAPKDPGLGANPPATVLTKTTAEYELLDLAQREAFHEKNGVIEG